MAGITNLAKGAAKNIAQALSTDGVGKALAKRAAMGAGIGAVGGGTLSAIQGGSFGEGAVRGGFVGAGIGAATGAYKMGAFGNSVLDEAGRFRKGATSVYSHLASGNATWEQVNMYRQKDINAFMGHMRDAQGAEDLAARFRQMDSGAKTSHGTNPEQLKWDLSNGTIVGGTPAKEVADNATKDAAAKEVHTEAASEANNTKESISSSFEERKKALEEKLSNNPQYQVMRARQRSAEAESIKNRMLPTDNNARGILERASINESMDILKEPKLIETISPKRQKTINYYNDQIAKADKIAWKKHMKEINQIAQKDPKLANNLFNNMK